MEFENSSSDLLEKVKACNSEEELLALAEEEGLELIPEQLDAISGGLGSEMTFNKKCPQCGYERAAFVMGFRKGRVAFRCLKCEEVFDGYLTSQDTVG